eukprot:s319_g9.t1
MLLESLSLNFDVLTHFWVKHEGYVDKDGTFWEEDEYNPGVWWYWSDGQGWGRWKDKDDSQASSVGGGWCNKTAALVHMHRNGCERELDLALTKLRSHHALRRPLQTLDGKVNHKGKLAYKEYI